MTDPIADMFTRIRNASAVRKTEILLPMSKVKYEVAKILEAEGWIKKAEVVPGSVEADRHNFDQLKLSLKYKKNGQSQISYIQRVSTPGSRVYVSKGQLPNVLNNFGIAIVSTSMGMMTNKEARRKSLGGDLIGEVY